MPPLVLRNGGDQQASLQNLPTELLSSITRVLGINDALSLAATCRRYHAMLTDLVYIRQMRYESWACLPFQWGVENNMLSTVERCLRLGADPDEQSDKSSSHIRHVNPDDYVYQDGWDSNSSTPPFAALLTALRRGFLDMTRLLLSHGADPTVPVANYCPITLASACGLHDVIELMLSTATSRAAARRMVNVRSGNGCTPLHDAARTGKDAVVQLLIDHGAHIEARCASGHTPLLWAAKWSQPSIVRILLRAGADPWVSDNNGSRLHDEALDATDGGGSRVPELLELIITSTLRKPLSSSEETGVKRYRILLDSSDTHGMLMCCIPSIVRLLLESGAATDALHETRKTTALWEYAGPGKYWSLGKPVQAPWQLRMFGNEIVGVLLGAGADADFRASRYRGMTPLMRAAETDNLEVAKLLLTQGRADVNAKDDRGWTALEYGLQRRQGGFVADYLREHQDHDSSKGAP
ncbi:ankyrin repeat-containing domain protein [Microdochium bolleyi]|uniref:Ankyrin repeat-containing domain protein n=1 Tax=Microdochium bolleyi TaxID=196109 RepID=A0A136ITZ2_9PEZI|nr:ankyrin repeat-containing domain protein [Microdochium bolleyi]